MKRVLIYAGIALASLSLSSCLKGEADDYDAWRDTNDAYIKAINTEEFEKITPDWAPQNSVYIKWHNNRALTAGNLVAMSNSTVDIKYELEDINGKKLENSYGALSGDSVYRSKPNGNVIGMWIAMTTMHVGDSATVIVPYPSGYGSQMSGNMLPYTNLIFHMKIKDIKALEKPYN